MSAKSVAVLGASSDPTKYGNKAVRAYLRHGWEVYPINPKAVEIAGCRAYARLADVPARIDRVTLYLPPARGIEALPEIAAAAPAEFFVNPGAESDQLVAEAGRLGLDPILACSIIDIGATPAEYPD